MCPEGRSRAGYFSGPGRDARLDDLAEKQAFHGGSGRSDFRSGNFLIPASANVSFRVPRIECKAGRFADDRLALIAWMKPNKW